MRILILGGTAWLGREIAIAAVTAGHQVVCLARGRSGSVADGAQLVRADRDMEDAYDSLGQHRWDVLIDVARQPGQVRRAAESLASVTAHAVFVSSGNVYADHSQKNLDESAAILPPLSMDVMPGLEAYGAAKVACEEHFLATFGPDRTTFARAGLIGGPGDVSDRSGYWPWRFSNPAGGGGSVLVPDAPEATAQLIDVRDLATWLIHAATERIAGAYNTTGETLSLAEHLAIAHDVAGEHAELVHADGEWLLARDVRPWMGPRSLPLWLPGRESAGFTSRNSSHARTAGLHHRPLESTLADTLVWEQTRPEGRERGAGLSDADERVLLAELYPTRR